MTEPPSEEIAVLRDVSRRFETAATGTSPEVMERYRAMLLSRSPSERVIMAARMFDAARTMVLASLPRNLSPDERRRHLFARLYGDDIPASQVPEALRPHKNQG